MRFMRNRTTAVVAGAAAIVALSATGSVAGQLIGSADIKDDSVRSIDIQDETIRAKDLRPGAVNMLQGKDGKDGKDGVSNLTVGAGYASLGGHDYWAANSYGETIETCPEGQYAIGGGFSQDASTGVDGKYDLGGKTDVQITVSAPYFRGEYKPVDEAGNFRADQWVVRGYNNTDAPVDVRAWVVCANVAD